MLAVKTCICILVVKSSVKSSAFLNFPYSLHIQVGLRSPSSQLRDLPACRVKSTRRTADHSSVQSQHSSMSQVEARAIHLSTVGLAGLRTGRRSLLRAELCRAHSQSEYTFGVFYVHRFYNAVLISNSVSIQILNFSFLLLVFYSAKC